MHDKIIIIFYLNLKHTDNLEVTGVSRSGRVRKKSSKLMDFRSPDDIDAARALKRSHTLSKSPQSKSSTLNQQYQYNLSTLSSPQSQLLPPSISSSNLKDLMNSAAPASVLNIKDTLDTDIDLNSSEDNLQNNAGSTSAFHLNSKNMTESNDIDDDDDDFGLTIDTNVRKSVYMTEKSSKKQMLKDGKVVMGRPQRKDKGKSRFTAYMLWSKEARQSMQAANPNMDFATISRRLGEMWANVPSSEKYNWRKRAKRLVTKSSRPGRPPKIGKLLNDLNDDLSSPQKVPTSKFLNKNSTPKTGKRRRGRPLKKSLHLKDERKTSVVQSPKIDKSLILNDSKNISANKNKHTSSKTSPSTSTVPKISIGPADVAAHLKLLGDSLTIIGQRLKEHEVMIIY